MKNLTWQNPEQLFVAQELINNVKLKCCGIKVYHKYDNIEWNNPLQRNKLIRDIKKWIEQKEEARRKAEEEARRKAEEEARRKAEEEARRKAEEKAKKKAEAKVKRKAKIEEIKNKVIKIKEQAKLIKIEKPSIISKSWFWISLAIGILVPIILIKTNSFNYYKDLKIISNETIDTIIIDYSQPVDTILFPFKNKKNIYGFVDKTGEIVIPCQWNDAHNFKEGLAQIKDKNKKWGYIDSTGIIVIPCQWIHTESFCEGRACVKDDQERYGFINKAGKVIIPCKWKAAKDFKNGWAKVEDFSNKWGFIDTIGNVVIPCKWSKVYDFKDDRALVQDSYGAWLYIDKKGQKCRYQ